MKRIAAVAVACGAMIAPSAALASGSSPTSSAYKPHYSAVKDTGASRSSTPTPKSSPTAATSSPTAVKSVDSDQATRSAGTAASSLPFTGIDLVPLVAGGAVLLGAGVAVRRLSSENS